MRRCPVCGTEYPGGDFCPMDGSPLEELLPPMPDPLPTASMFTGGPELGGAAAHPRPDPWSAPVSSTDPAELMAGETLDGRYRLDARIGAGGMGIVYRATHVLIDKPVAVKVLRAAHTTEAGVAKRFSQEARLASKIKHPNVVPIFDFGTASNGCPYYVMDFLRGHSLAWEIDNRGALDPERALRVAIQTASGLAAAHEHGVIHRDLKPDNVFLEPGPDGVEQAKLLDFGIARQEGRKTRLTAAGAVVGTPEYMSPEQAQGNEVDARTDIYALGVILFEMLTAQVPFRADSLVGVLTKQVFDAPPPLRDLAPELPHLPQIEGAIARMLAKNADERPATAQDAITLMERAADADLGQPDAPGGRARATVAIGSWSVGDSVPRVPSAPASPSAQFARPGGAPMASFAPPRGAPAAAMAAAPLQVSDIGSAPLPLSAPEPIRVAPSAPQAAPLQVARVAAVPDDERPTAYFDRAGAGRVARVPTGPLPASRRSNSWAPMLILGFGAAVAAALLTFGLVRYLGQSSGAEPAPAPSRAESGTKKGAHASTAAPSPTAAPQVSPPAGTPQARGEATPMGGPEADMTEPTASATSGAATGASSSATKRTTGTETGTAKKPSKANKSKSSDDGDANTPPPETVPTPSPAPKPAPQDPPPAPSVSLGDLKDPFSDP